MKATKKIVGATAALVAAVALSAGSTFAWFATSGTAKIDGMTVNIKSPTNLYISAVYTTNADQITETEVKFATATSSLSPVTHDAVSSGSVSFKYATDYSQDPTTGTPGTASEFQTVGKVDVANGLQNESGQTIASYVAGNQISIVRKAESDSTATYTLNATVTISGVVESNNNYKYLRCAFFDGTTINESGDLTNNSGTITWTPTNLATGVEDNEVKNYVFLLWYEGTDPDCFSDNAVKSDSLSVSIEFSTVTTPSAG